ncbi:hypothetical protein [Enterovibrio paralichthyis]|uniref:hypothetical protein n=1 Tax=Enterovibrio paralichthyis TaxID=2853805 RepID=UPI001C46DD37|nr:hypothetical protein [Enterovibrio paralichthyis]MBV7296821.1 hypothetical protein [Enterovibrio paralichthyis]
MFQQTLNPYERAQFFLVGEFIYIDTAPATVRVTTKRGSYELAQGAQVIDASADGGDVYLELTGDQAGLVRVISGYGRYVPPADGQKVNVSQMPAVQFDGEQPVSLQSLPPVAFDGEQPVRVASMPALDVNPVEVTKLPSLNINGMPALYIAPNQSVSVEQLPPVEFKEDVTVPVSAHINAPLWVNERSNKGFKVTDVVLGVEAYSVPVWQIRTRIELKASASNAGELKCFPRSQDVESAANALIIPVGGELVLDIWGDLFIQGAEGDAVTVVEFYK